MVKLTTSFVFAITVATASLMHAAASPLQIVERNVKADQAVPTMEKRQWYPWYRPPPYRPYDWPQSSLRASVPSASPMPAVTGAITAHPTSTSVSASHAINTVATKSSAPQQHKPAQPSRSPSPLSHNKSKAGPAAPSSSVAQLQAHTSHSSDAAASTEAILPQSSQTSNDDQRSSPYRRPQWEPWRYEYPAWYGRPWYMRRRDSEYEEVARMAEYKRYLQMEGDHGF